MMNMEGKFSKKYEKGRELGRKGEIERRWTIARKVGSRWGEVEEKQY